MSTFPAVSDAALARKKAAAKDRRAAKKAEWDAEIARLREAKARRDREEDERNQPTLKNEKLLRLLSSQSFRDFLTEHVGCDADEWVRDILRADNRILAMMKTSYEDHVRYRIFKSLRVHRWDHPAYRRYWANQAKISPDPAKRRRIILRLATPKWADPIKMSEFYTERDRKTNETGEPHDVDHIVPLQHPLVCGLNNEFNLRVISSSVNRMKSNFFLVT